MESFIIGIFFSLIGIAYFSYGRKQDKIVPLIIGLILLVFPYLISNIYLMVSIGILLTITPYFIRR